jgi:predicted TIM-barrel fold metal-dependent hydrolase
MSALQDAIEAIRKIDTQAELNTLAEEWKRQQTYIANRAKVGLKIGDMVEWESRGVVNRGTIRKINRKTMEIVEPNRGMWGSTVYKVPASMVLGKV